jgi:hypothetical protein
VRYTAPLPAFRQGDWDADAWTAAARQLPQRKDEERQRDDHNRDEATQRNQRQRIGTQNQLGWLGSMEASFSQTHASNCVRVVWPGAKRLYRRPHA